MYIPAYLCPAISGFNDVCSLPIFGLNDICLSILREEGTFFLCYYFIYNCFFALYRLTTQLVFCLNLHVYQTRYNGP